jgi:hypothetical protein
MAQNRKDVAGSLRSSSVDQWLSAPMSQCAVLGGGSQAASNGYIKPKRLVCLLIYASNYPLTVKAYTFIVSNMEQTQSLATQRVAPFHSAPPAPRPFRSSFPINQACSISALAQPDARIGVHQLCAQGPCSSDTISAISRSGHWLETRGRHVCRLLLFYFSQ